MSTTTTYDRRQQAEADWTANANGVQSEWQGDRAAFVAYRERELAGSVRLNMADNKSETCYSVGGQPATEAFTPPMPRANVTTTPAKPINGATVENVTTAANAEWENDATLKSKIARKLFVAHKLHQAGLETPPEHELESIRQALQPA